MHWCAADVAEVEASNRESAAKHAEEVERMIDDKVEAIEAADAWEEACAQLRRSHADAVEEATSKHADDAAAALAAWEVRRATALAHHQRACTKAARAHEIASEVLRAGNRQRKEDHRALVLVRTSCHRTPVCDL